jgi:hypothetical protein
MTEQVNLMVLLIADLHVPMVASVTSALTTPSKDLIHVQKLR